MTQEFKENPFTVLSRWAHDRDRKVEGIIQIDKEITTLEKQLEEKRKVKVDLIAAQSNYESKIKKLYKEFE
jgi:hypothetical protein